MASQSKQRMTEQEFIIRGLQAEIMQLEAKLDLVAKNEAAMPEVLWDDADNITRCSECLYEVVGGVCQSPDCGVEHQEDTWEEDMEGVHYSVTTSNEHIRDDRYPACRGTTPLLTIDVSMLSDHNILKGYTTEEYAMLLKRGATRSMIATFNLEFNKDTGIRAWADQTLFDEFSGAAMQKLDRWCISLGRRVQLDAEDVDGSIFIEELLEEMAYAPKGSWETVLESDADGRTWHTRPVDPDISEENESEEEEEEEEEAEAEADAEAGEEEEGEEGEEGGEEEDGEKDELGDDDHEDEADLPPAIDLHNYYQDELEGRPDTPSSNAGSESDIPSIGAGSEIDSDRSFDPYEDLPNTRTPERSPIREQPSLQLDTNPEAPHTREDSDVEMYSDSDGDVPGSDWDSDASG